MKRKSLSFVLTIIAGSIGMGFVVALIIMQLTGFLDEHDLMRAIFVGAVVVLVALFAIALFSYFSQRALVKSLQIENEYILGKKSVFNNLYAFQKIADAVSKFAFKRKYSQHIVAFTISNLNIAQNVNRNIEIFALNSYLVDVLDNLYKELKANKRNYIFAFSRGSFLVYALRQTEQSLQQLTEYLSKEIYDFAERECRHLWVQPFFGIAVVNKEEPITSIVENALIARDFSERNFETVTFYQPSFRKTASENDIEELNNALANDEFVVYYQPKYNLEKKEFISSEALIRWNSKKYGLLPPSKFLGKAEDIGLVHEIDTFVLKRVCEDLADLRRRGRRVLPVSVNFSLYEFYSGNFLDTIMATLREFRIPPHLIEIEITEATSQANQFLSISIIKKLKEQGIRVLMDDFGVGFSNVGNLKKIPFDVVKIDKSFIDDVLVDTKSREIVRFLIGLCKVNNMEVVAEGVDKKEQVEFLRKAHCDTIQGFYYSRALSKSDFEKFLASNPFEKEVNNA